MKIMTKLNIITILYRKEFLEQQYETIPKKKFIKWIICKTKSWGHIPKYIKNSKELNVKVCEVNCEETRSAFEKKADLGLRNMDHGYFFFLDDDNKIHKNMIKTFQEFKFSNYEMIIGKQQRKNKQIYLNAWYPAYGMIDMGNVLCHTKVAKKVNYFKNIHKHAFKVYGTNDIDAYDYPFWILCKEAIEQKNTLLLNDRIIANYNFFR